MGTQEPTVPTKRMRGSVKMIKFYENDDGSLSRGAYCFIAGNEDGIDRFAHMSEFTEADWNQLEEHQSVVFTPVLYTPDREGRRRERAMLVRVVVPGTFIPINEDNAADTAIQNYVPVTPPPPAPAPAPEPDAQFTLPARTTRPRQPSRAMPPEQRRRSLPDDEA